MYKPTDIACHRKKQHSGACQYPIRAWVMRSFEQRTGDHVFLNKGDHGGIAPTGVPLCGGFGNGIWAKLGNGRKLFRPYETPICLNLDGAGWNEIRQDEGRGSKPASSFEVVPNRGSDKGLHVGLELCEAPSPDLEKGTFSSKGERRCRSPFGFLDEKSPSRCHALD